MARPVTAPAAKIYRPRTCGPFPPPQPLRPPPGPLRTGSPAWRFRRVLRPCWPTGGRPARRHRRTFRVGRRRGHRQLRQVIARAVRCRERDKPQEASGDQPGHFGEAAEVGGLTSGLGGPDGDSVAAVRHAISSSWSSSGSIDCATAGVHNGTIGAPPATCSARTSRAPSRRSGTSTRPGTVTYRTWCSLRVGLR